MYEVVCVTLMIMLFKWDNSFKELNNKAGCHRNEMPLVNDRNTKLPTSCRELTCRKYFRAHILFGKLCLKLQYACICSDRAREF